MANNFTLSSGLLGTSIGPVNPHGSLNSQLWTRNPPVVPSPTFSECPAAWWGAMKFDAEKQFRGTSIVFVPGTSGAGKSDSDGSHLMAPSQYGHALLHSLDWEVYVTPPCSDIEELTASDWSDMGNRPLWESLAGFFVAGVWEIEVAQTRFMKSPIAIGLHGNTPLNTRSQYIRSRFEFPAPLAASAGSRIQIALHFDKTWRPVAPVTIRCTVNFSLGPSI